MIHEVIVVEGKSDIRSVTNAVDAECIATEGYTLRKAVVEKIRIAYEKRGIIVLTDPDSAGERIRKTLAKYFPKAKHAFVPREEAFKNGDIGVEQASPEAIRRALSKVRTHEFSIEEIFDRDDLWDAGLMGQADSALRRNKLGAELGIGYSNGKQFLYRLNHYGITRDEFNQALRRIEEK